MTTNRHTETVFETVIETLFLARSYKSMIRADVGAAA
jgi:hypothetical protein